MRAKKPQNQSRSIRYLLSADSRLRKLSLKRISARPKNVKPAERSNRSRKAARENGAVPFSWPISSRATILAVAGVLAGAALITARQPAPRADIASAGAEAALHAPVAVNEAPVVNAPPADAPMPASLQTRKRGPSKALDTAAAARPENADASLRQPRAVPPVASTATNANATARVVGSAPAAQAERPEAEAPSATAAKADTANAGLVTIAGCLERDEETFWLKDTSGTGAPKSRSWRSGFLKKRPSRIEVVDAANSLKLTEYVGERVTATGTLLNREMRPRSLQRLGATCR